MTVNYQFYRVAPKSSLMGKKTYAYLLNIHIFLFLQSLMPLMMEKVMQIIFIPGAIWKYKHM